MQNEKGAPDHFQNSGNMINNATESKRRWLGKIQCTGILNENVTKKEWKWPGKMQRTGILRKKKKKKMARKDAMYRDLSNFQKLAGLWLVGEVGNHVAIYGSKVAEGFSAFQRRSCMICLLFASGASWHFSFDSWAWVLVILIEHLVEFSLSWPNTTSEFYNSINQYWYYVATHVHDVISHVLMSDPRWNCNKRCCWDFAVQLQFSFMFTEFISPKNVA